MGYFVANGELLRWITALVTGIVVATVVRIVDLQMMTLDIYAATERRTLLGESTAHKPSAWRRASPFLARLVLLGLSLALTSPFLALLLYRAEIRRELDRQVVTLLETTRQALTADQEQRVAAWQNQIAQTQAAYEREVAGIGPSRHYGNGRVAAAIHLHLEELKQQREEERQRTQANIDRFNSLSADWKLHREEIEASFGINLPKEGLITDRRVMGELSKLPEYRATEWAVRGFLLVLWLAQLVLKLSQPRSVSLYLSEVLHGLYERYLRDQFGGRLPIGIRDAEQFRSAVLAENLRPTAPEFEMLERQERQVAAECESLKLTREEAQRGADRASAALGRVESEKLGIERSLEVDRCRLDSLALSPDQGSLRVELDTSSRELIQLTLQKRMALNQERLANIDRASCERAVQTTSREFEVAREVEAAKQVELEFIRDQLRKLRFLGIESTIHRIRSSGDRAA